jgi:replication-associated recombination protein RarA
MIQELFTERYRPKTLDQLILPSRIRKSFGNGELHQNFLLFGSPGLGKCVVGDTKIEVLDTNTNTQLQLTVAEFIELCKSQNAVK